MFMMTGGQLGCECKVNERLIPWIFLFNVLPFTIPSSAVVGASDERGTIVSRVGL